MCFGFLKFEGCLTIWLLWIDPIYKSQQNVVIQMLRFFILTYLPWLKNHMDLLQCFFSLSRSYIWMGHAIFRLKCFFYFFTIAWSSFIIFSTSKYNSFFSYLVLLWPLKYILISCLYLYFSPVFHSGLKSKTHVKGWSPVLVQRSIHSLYLPHCLALPG